jgi:3-oxoacyl-[acyl-carrier-protein] synthase II
MKRRVVITGRGAVTPLGAGVAGFWAALLAGECGIEVMPDLAGSACPVVLGAPVRPPAGGVPLSSEARKRSKLMGKHIQFAFAAGLEAMAESGLAGAGLDPTRFGVFIGTAHDRGDLLRSHACLLRMRSVADPSVVDERSFWPAAQALYDPLEFLRTLPNGPAAHLAMHHLAQGPNATLLADGVAGLQAVGEAARVIERGDADVMLAGGTDSLLAVERLVAQGLLGHLCRRLDGPAEASRPFDLGRAGVVPGEGGAVLVLEAAEVAERRGARIFGEVTGYAVTADADDDGGEAGLALAVSRALDDAGLAPSGLGYVCAAGLSHPDEDARETAALKAALGVAAGAVPVSSTKAQLGFLGNAAGPLDAITSLLALEHGVLPPTRNYSTPDPRCDLDYVPNAPRPAVAHAALVEARDFLGLSACLVLTRWPGIAS